MGHLWEREHKKFGAPVCYSGSFFWRQHKHLSDSVQQPAVMDGEWSVKKAWSIAPFTSSEARLTDGVLKQGDNKRREFSFIITITVISCFFGGEKKKDNKHRQRYNHALTDPQREREREGWLAREESALWMFDTLGQSRGQTFRYDIKVVSSPTWIHATTTQIGVVAAWKKP